jgi:hypothetical protein
MVRSQLTSPSKRSLSFFDQRLLWDYFETRYQHSSDFGRLLRMQISSFNKLVHWIKQDLQVNNEMAELRGGVIPPSICLYVTIRDLAGGSYLDIIVNCGISSSSFYDCVWQTIHALPNCDEISINFLTTTEAAMKAAVGFNSAITTCVAVVDGNHLQIETPRKSEALNGQSYFSGHYKTYGVNVHGM